MNVDWDNLADHADNGLAKDLGELNRRFEAGRVESYLIVYQWHEDNGTKCVSINWDRDNPITAAGYAQLANHTIVKSFEDVEVEG